MSTKSVPANGVFRLAQLLVIVLACDCGLCNAQYTGGPANEYGLLQHLIASNPNAGLAIWNCVGGAPDQCGLVGSNSYLHGITTTGNVGSGPFQADEQRGAIENMLSGIALYGTGVISNSLCDTYVAEGMAAIQAAYAVQIPGTAAQNSSNGTFYFDVNETYPGPNVYAYEGAWANGDITITGSTPIPAPPTGSKSGNSGANTMTFFLAWSNHALLLMTQVPHYYGTASHPGLYYQALQNLLPNIENALDYLYFDGFNGTSYVGAVYPTSETISNEGLNIEVATPNRTMIVACGFRFGELLFQTVGAGTSGDLANWQTAAQWWLNNEFVSCAYFAGLANPRPLFDQNTGAFYEGGFSTSNSNMVGAGNSGYGYDSNYQAVASRFLYYYAAEAPGDFPNLNNVVVNAGRFLERRMLSYGLYVDDTDDTRTGPTGGYPENKIFDFDYVSARWALLYYDLLVNNIVDGGTGSQTDGLAAVERFSVLSATPALPPTIVNTSAALSDVIVGAGTTYTSTSPAFNFYANNAGVMGTDTFTMDPNFGINVTGTLPAGLSLGSPTSYAQGAGNGDAGYLGQNVGWVPVVGTTSTTGTYTVTMTPQNSPYVYTFANSPPYYSSISDNTPATNVYSPPTVSGGSTAQQGGAVSVTFNVYNTNSTTATNDAYVRDGSYASTNFGTATTMPVRLATATGFNRIVYAMFSPGTISGTIYKAYLRLYGDYGTDATYAFTNLQCYGIPSTSWTQSTITWNNQPGLSSGTLLSTSTVYQVFPGFPEQYYQWDVTSWVTGHSGAVSFALAQATALLGDANFNSTNFGSNPPQLVIYYR